MKSDSLLKKAGPYGYILPALLVFAVFLFYPFFKTIYLSLYKTNKMGQASCLWDWEIIWSCFSRNHFITVWQ